MENLEEYIDSMVEFCLERGIARQMDALRKGFSRVFPIEKLRAFTPTEVRILFLCFKHVSCFNVGFRFS